MNQKVMLLDRGILHPQLGRKTYHLTRYAPSPNLVGFVHHFWIARWDLRGKDPFRQEILQYPCINLVFEEGRTRIYGVNTGKSAKILKGKGHVLGVLFQPGGFHPFFRKPIFTLTDHTIDCRLVFGDETDEAESDILSAGSEQDMVTRAEMFLRTRLPVKDENVSFVRSIVDEIIENRDIIKVDDVVEKFGLNKRTMQRLFKQYIGVSPKFVIQRSRIHEAALSAANGDAPDWAKLAIDLGYFDQSHFIKDFIKQIGSSPDDYAKQTYAKNQIG